MKRDSEVEKQLRSIGWAVLRFWGKDIRKDLTACVEEVKDTIFEVKLSFLGEFIVAGQFE
jgi:DNA mismatch endonuclease (patch repair protein)